MVRRDNLVLPTGTKSENLFLQQRQCHRHCESPALSRCSPVCADTSLFQFPRVLIWFLLPFNQTQEDSNTTVFIYRADTCELSATSWIKLMKCVLRSPWKLSVTWQTSTLRSITPAHVSDVIDFTPPINFIPWFHHQSISVHVHVYKYTWIPLHYQWLYSRWGASNYNHKHLIRCIFTTRPHNYEYMWHHWQKAFETWTVDFWPTMLHANAAVLTG